MRKEALVREIRWFSCEGSGLFSEQADFPNREICSPVAKLAKTVSAYKSFRKGTALKWLKVTEAIMLES